MGLPLKVSVYRDSWYTNKNWAPYYLKRLCCDLHLHMEEGAISQRKQVASRLWKGQGRLAVSARSWKGQGMNPPLEPLELTQPYGHLDFSPVLLTSDSWPLVLWENRFLLLKAIRFVVTYNSKQETNTLVIQSFLISSLRGTTLQIIASLTMFLKCL